MIHRHYSLVCDSATYSHCLRTRVGVGAFTMTTPSRRMVWTLHRCKSDPLQHCRGSDYPAGNGRTCAQIRYFDRHGSGSFATWPRFDASLTCILGGVVVRRAEQAAA